MGWGTHKQKSHFTPFRPHLDNEEAEPLPATSHWQWLGKNPS